MQQVKDITSNGGTPLVVSVNKKVVGVIELHSIAHPIGIAWREVQTDRGKCLAAAQLVDIRSGWCHCSFRGYQAD